MKKTSCDVIYERAFTYSEFERDVLGLDLDGLVVLAGFPQLGVCDDAEDVERVHDVLGRTPDPGS